MFLDRTAPEGISYYRIEAVGEDGTHQYSSVVSVLLTSGGTFAVVPNPVDDNAELLLSTPWTGAILLRTVDASGRIVHEQNATVNEGDQRLALRWNTLEPGCYLLLLLDPHGELKGRVPFVRD